MKKLRSFTIVELVVALLISSLVIGIMYYAWSFLNHQLGKRMAVSSGITESILFERAFKRDIEWGDRVETFSDTQHILIGRQKRTIGYFIDRARIIRVTGGLSDTFSMGGRIRELRHMGNIPALISNIRIDLSVNNEQMAVYFKKEYTAEELLRAQKDPHE